MNFSVENRRGQREASDHPTVARRPHGLIARAAVTFICAGTRVIKDDFNYG
jgi:hypothetical protein